MCEGLPFWEPPATARVLAVPADYAPPAGAVGHARAMQYAAQHGAASGGDWVVYLGAASVLRERTVRPGQPRATRARPAAAAASLMRVRPARGRWTPSWRTWWTRRIAWLLRGGRTRRARTTGTACSTAASRRCARRWLPRGQRGRLTQSALSPQGPMCVGQTGGSWMGFLSDTRRAGEAHGILRWQVCVERTTARASPNADALR